MSTKFTYAGLAVGIGLTLCAILGGFSGFILGLVLAAIGGVVGAQLDGLIDVRNIVASARGGRG